MRENNKISNLTKQIKVYKESHKTLRSIPWKASNHGQEANIHKKLVIYYGLSLGVKNNLFSFTVTCSAL